MLTAVPPRTPAPAADRATSPSPGGSPVQKKPAPAASAAPASAAPAPRPPVRPGLGEPIGELPATARRIGAGTTSPPTPTAPTPATPTPAGAGGEAQAMPVMRRMAEPEPEPEPAPAPPETPTKTAPPRPARSGLGAPLRELPPTAAPLLGGPAAVQRRTLPNRAGAPTPPSVDTTAPVRPRFGTPDTGPDARPHPLVAGSRPAEQTATGPTPGAPEPSSTGSTPAPSGTPAVQRAPDAVAPSPRSTPVPLAHPADAHPEPLTVSRAMEGTPGPAGGPTTGTRAQGPSTGTDSRAAEERSAAPRVPLAAPSTARSEPLIPVSRAVEKGSAPSSGGSSSGDASSGPTVERTPAPGPADRADSTSRTPAARASAPVVPLVQRTRSLLADRPLVVGTGAPAGFSASAPTPSASGAPARPVVAATWRRDLPPDPVAAPAPASPAPPAPQPAVQRAARAPRPTGAAGGPTPPGRGLLARLRPAPSVVSPHAVRSAPGSLPPVQRATAPDPAAASAPPGAGSARTTPTTPSTPTAPTARTTPAVPVVRLDQSASSSTGVPAAGRATAPVQRLAAQPLTYTRGAGAVAEPPAPPVVARPAAPERLQAKAVQRMADAGLQGVPVTPVARSASPAQAAGTAHAPAKNAPSTDTPTTSPKGGRELDELARQLIDPVARLLRAEMRRGRERTGRPYDNRR
ncbi:hypothetical protein ACIPPS_01955 [Streptomyces sp. NPDC090127]|uniref:hypothetical protein n=1 Tax=Streptomyces sp. NPDC090127 TaxID=3365953 RepID=UPI00380D3F1C